ncbi:hypothetical protein G6F42_015397 [Rhizopus arrhizus]|nr:hypothetical protein G6F42_015397 [Rhizopus arrhizus]
MNRRGGCTSRTKNNKNGLSQDDYTIDMHQNDFGHGSNAAAAAAAAAATGGAMGATATHTSTEPLSPFDNTRRYAPAAATAGGVYGANNTEPYGDYHEAYSQAGYSQGGYSQEGYSQDGYNGYGQQPEYGYYDGGNYAAAGAVPGVVGAAGYDSNRHEINNNMYANNNYDPSYQSKHYSDLTSPTSAGNLSEGYSSVDKPNVKDYNSKPNEM